MLSVYFTVLSTVNKEDAAGPVSREKGIRTEPVRTGSVKWQAIPAIYLEGVQKEKDIFAGMIIRNWDLEKFAETVRGCVLL